MSAAADPPEIYLDHAASSPLRAEARAAWLAAADIHHANPTGAHRAARAARRALDEARASIAVALGRDPGEIVFTSGGSESDNLAVRGVVGARGGRVVCTAGEHHAVIEPTETAAGLTTGLLADGTVDLGSLAEVLDAPADVTLVSVISVNNETGSISPLDEVAAVTHAHAPGALLHTDAVQAVQWIDVEKSTADCDLVSVTAHKIGGPVGIGALVVRDGVELDPLILGGGQERGRRAGTPAVAQAAAFAAALQATVRDRDATVARITALRDRLLDGLVAQIGDRVVVTADPNGRRDHLAGGIAHVCFRDVESEALLFLLDAAGLRASAASSCSSGAQQHSHVLDAMGVAPDLAGGSLRLSLGHTTTGHDIDRALEIVPAAIGQLDRFG
jgi:cysteine desulfurase